MEDFDPYHQWLGIPPAEQPANHYRLLALQIFEDDPRVIESAADQRMAHLRTLQAGKHSALSQKLLNELAAARICLLNPAKKAEYDARLRQELAAKVPAAGEPDDSFSQIADIVATDRTAAGVGRPRGHAKGLDRRLRFAGLGTAIVLVAGLLVWGLYPRNEPPPQSLAVTSGGEGPRKDERGKARRPAAPKTSTSADAGGRKDEEAEKAPAAVAKGKSPDEPAMPDEGGINEKAGTSQAESKAKSEPNDEPLPEKVEAKPAAPKPAAGSTEPQAPAQPAETAKRAKLPVPEESALEAAAKLARQVFVPDFDAATSSSAKQALAKKILAKGVEIENDPRRGS